jgi:hypothetical protein
MVKNAIHLISWPGWNASEIQLFSTYGIFSIFQICNYIVSVEE